MAKKTHKHVEFAVGRENTTEERVFRTFNEAAAHAVARAASDGYRYAIDVLIMSEAGARWYGGDWGVEQYREDPEASVFERLFVKVDYIGRVP